MSFNEFTTATTTSDEAVDIRIMRRFVFFFFPSLHTSYVCVCVRSRINKYTYIAIFNVQSPTLTYSAECHCKVFFTLAQISLFIHFAPFCLSTVSFFHHSNSCESIFIFIFIVIPLKVRREKNKKIQ